MELNISAFAEFFENLTPNCNYSRLYNSNRNKLAFQQV